MSKPYQLPKEAAVVLAQICCSPYGYLPQGAPTSPIISNMICSRLDGELTRLAKQRKCEYTRYADDITFSSRIKRFASDIVQIDYVDGKIVIVLGDALLKIIESNGFRINPKKTKYRNSGTRQEVTGLVVNEKVNVKRKFMRQVRAMLHNHRVKQDYTDNEKMILLRKVEGKLNFIRSIRGSKDRAYLVLANQFNKIVGAPVQPLDAMEAIESAVWFLEVSGVPNGSAFVLGQELITCAHVIEETINDKIKVCRWQGDQKLEYTVSVFGKNKGLDLAILKFIQPPPVLHSLMRGDSSKLQARQNVILTGYPAHIDQRSFAYYDAKIVAKKEVLLPLFLVDRMLWRGMSGAPVINSNNEVVGIVAFGDLALDGKHSPIHGFLPINSLDQVEKI